MLAKLKILGQLKVKLVHKQGHCVFYELGVMDWSHGLESWIGVKEWSILKWKLEGKFWSGTRNLIPVVNFVSV